MTTTGQETLTTNVDYCAHEKNVCTDGVLITFESLLKITFFESLL